MRKNVVVQEEEPIPCPNPRVVGTPLWAHRCAAAVLFTAALAG